ncbi:adenosylcobinamide-phosphate synthase CbiB [Anaeromicrobium sediminis]|uniref:Cobalamin biosynthesis protein CobD n=1 Tax=Anaeromicrobium sediminis TaxID=1478221 RepID=A0A267MPV9_9FIRM|nr:adenosylcobinamide-phosphate synthase CbiB [Anaeromicrobium sediminis]PAB60770.1 cobalamin biosynthesis protein CobD [Anaeromicrobium sediminis]
MLKIVIGYIGDIIFGDPYAIPHPIRFIGKLIRFLEDKLRKFSKDNKGEKLMGCILVLLTVSITYIVTYYLVNIWNIIDNSGYIAKVVETFFIFQILATKSLDVETRKVLKPLKEKNIGEARKFLSYIVGRDTRELNEKEMTRACIETIAESTSDGIIAPLLFIFIGGAPLGMAYKAVNTLDSMVGYKNDKYYYFGWASARVDDIVGFIPARITGIVTIITAFFMRYDCKNAFKIFIRDRLNHKSPNSAHGEAAFAGALQIQIGGTNTYFGKKVYKPTIGDNIKELEVDHINDAIRLMYGVSFVGLLTFLVIF